MLALLGFAMVFVFMFLIMTALTSLLCIELCLFKKRNEVTTTSFFFTFTLYFELTNHLL